MSALMATISHTPVLVDAVIEYLRGSSPGGRYIDCTVGSGGHSQAILNSFPGSQLLGIDADPEAIRLAQSILPQHAILVNANFAQIEIIATIHDFRQVDGILFDLGLSSMQLSETGRGFSFTHDAPLDMRFDPKQDITALDIVNNYPEKELARLLFQYGEEPASRKITRHIISHRPIRTTLELAAIIAQALGQKRGRIHPATRSFQALRIAVNMELDNLSSGLRQSIKLLRPGGRMVVISYHSLEDRIVKQFLSIESRGCICPSSIPVCVCGHSPTLKLLSRKAIQPSEDELNRNPRSRSARLRAAEKI